jgi:predicted dehydrogenase
VAGGFFATIFVMNPNSSKVRVAIIGTGGMAGLQFKGFSQIPECEVVAACDVDAAKAGAFAEKHGIPRHFGDLDMLFRECAVDAVTNVTPDRFHAPVSIHALHAGKHVLCEKPLAMNYKEAMDMVETAESRGLINMVNLTYRNSAALQKARELVSAGDLGEIVHVDMAYLQSWLVSTAWGDWRTNPTWLWRLSKAHGSTGVLGDLGIHAVDFASFPVGRITQVNARLKAFREFKGDTHADYTLDANDTALIHVEFENGALGTIHTTRWATGYLNTIQLRVFGAKGALRIDLDKSWDKFEVSLGEDMQKAVWREIECPPTPTNYRRFIDSILQGMNDQPDFRRGAEVQKVLDACHLSDERRMPIDL